MKLSEKYLFKIKANQSQGILFTNEELKVYSEIISLEAQQSFLVGHPYSIPQDKQLNLLSDIVNQLQEIAQKENL